ncbi:MAG: 2-amino-4-hydroxy-6-hydroxymethyldihydropteridine diphosphokinase [Armatimonadota bacterium]
MSVAYIGVGSNIEPERNILAALRVLALKTRLVAVSTFYGTEAIGPPGSPMFYNGVAKIETDLTPRELKFGVLKAIEVSLGRKRSGDKFAPRTIDLDLLLYDDLTVRENDLVIPDPDIGDREFVAKPLLELDPNVVMPDTGVRLADVLNATHISVMSPLTEFTTKLLEEFDIEPGENRASG